MGLFLKHNVGKSAGENKFSGIGSFLSFDNGVAFDEDLLPADIAEWQTLVQSFAPILHLHPEEAHQIVSVEEYLHKFQKTNNTGFDDLSLAESNNKDLSFFASSVDNSKKHTNGPHSYVNIKTGNQSFVELQYWFLFSGKSGSAAHIKWLLEGITGYQGKIVLNPIGCHRGHWERISVRLSPQDLSPIALFLPNAKGGEWLSYDKVEKEDKQAVVYVSRNNHFFYAAKGLKLIEYLKYDVFSSTLEFSMYDECSGKHKINFKKHCGIIHADAASAKPTAIPQWLHFEGQWGNPHPAYLNAVKVNQILKNAFGKQYAFLLNAQVMKNLSTFLIQYYGKDCRCKAQGPWQKKCWNGPEI